MSVSFRNASIGIAALASATMFGAFSAAGQQVADAQSPHGGSAACAHLDNKTDAGLRCEIRELDKRIEDAKRRGIEADKRGADADQRAAAAREQADAKIQEVKECNDFLKAGNAAGQFTRERILEVAGGKVTGDNLCAVAKALGHVGRKAALAPEIR